MKLTCLRLLLFFLLFLTVSTVFAQKTTVLLLPTIHRNHQKNSNYSYQDVLEITANFKPDVIALEIRPEDMEQDSVYLKQFYPAEMILVKNSFAGIRKVGVDYYGDEVRGKLMTPDVFRDTSSELGKFKLMERQLNSDSSIVARMKTDGITGLQEQQVKLVAISSANELMDGRYDRITRKFYSRLKHVLANTPYAWYEEFNERRDREISQNIRNLIIENRGKRIIVLTGGNHHDRAIQTVRRMQRVKILTRVKD